MAQYNDLYDRVLSTLNFRDEVFEEGANLKYHGVSKEAKKKSRVRTAVIKKFYKSGEYEKAREMIANTLKDLDEMKKEINSIESNMVSSLIGSTCHSVSTSVQAILTGLLTFGIGDMMVRATKYAKNAFQVTKAIQETDDFSWKVFNGYKNQIITNIDNTKKYLMAIDKKCIDALPSNHGDSSITESTGDDHISTIVKAVCESVMLENITPEEAIHIIGIFKN